MDYYFCHETRKLLMHDARDLLHSATGFSDTGIKPNLDGPYNSNSLHLGIVRLRAHISAAQFVQKFAKHFFTFLPNIFLLRQGFGTLACHDMNVWLSSFLSETHFGWRKRFRKFWAEICPDFGFLGRFWADFLVLGAIFGFWRA